MAKVPGCRPLAHLRIGHQATFANAAEFFNSLLDPDNPLSIRKGIPDPGISGLKTFMLIR
jgi:hypothetical protein